MSLWRAQPTDWEYERLQSLPKEEQEVVKRWFLARLLRTWQLWTAILLVWTVTLSSNRAGQAVAAAGGGPLAVVAVWVALHTAYGAAITRVLQPVHRRILREFLVALEDHTKETNDQRENRSVTPSE